MILAGISLRTIPRVDPRQKVFQKMPDQLGAPALNRLETRAAPSAACRERMVADLIQFALRVSEQLVQRSRKIVSVFTRDLLQLRLDTGELIRQHCLEHRHLVWENGRRGSFANAQFRARSFIVTGEIRD